jgi:hypothetical protein
MDKDGFYSIKGITLKEYNKGYIDGFKNGVYYPTILIGLIISIDILRKMQ